MKLFLKEFEESGQKEVPKAAEIGKKNQQKPDLRDPSFTSSEGGTRIEGWLSRREGGNVESMDPN